MLIARGAGGELRIWGYDGVGAGWKRAAPWLFMGSDEYLLLLYIHHALYRLASKSRGRPHSLYPHRCAVGAAAADAVFACCTKVFSFASFD